MKTVFLVSLLLILNKFQTLFSGVSIAESLNKQMPAGKLSN